MTAENNNARFSHSTTTSAAGYAGHSFAAASMDGNIEALRAQLATAQSVAQGAENLLQVVPADGEGKEELRAEVEHELATAKARITDISFELSQLESLASSSTSVPSSPSRLNGNRVNPIPFPSELETSIVDNPQVESFDTTFELVMTMLLKLDELEELDERVKSMNTIVAALERQARIKFELKLEDVLDSIMGCLSEKAGRDVRASTYRLLRHLIVDQHDVYQLQTHCLDFFLVRSLSRDSKFEIEKEQALRLIRHLLSLPDADRPVPPSVIRAIVAIAEHTDEKLRLASLETLGELLIRDIGLLISAEGLRVILQALTDGPHDLSPYLALGFLWVMDRPGSREFLRPGVDVEIVLAGFTEVQSKGSSQEERVRASAKIVSHFLQSWTGLLYLCVNKRQALKSLVDSLTTPSSFVREILLDTLISIFQITPPAWYSSSLIRRGQGHAPSIPEPAQPHDADQSGKSNLIDQYLAILLVAFIEAGLVDALVAVAANNKDAASARKVSFLISEILQLSTRVLPLSFATKVQALPRLFSLVSKFDTSDARLAATYTFSAMDEFSRNRSKVLISGTEGARPRSDSVHDSLKRGQRQVDFTKLRLGLQIDDANFRNLLLETQVLTTKNHTKWSFETLSELVEGPLLNASRLSEAMRASKFMHRVLGFFHPLAYRYSDLPKSISSAKYTKLACTLIRTLLANPDGIRYLMEDKLLRQISDCLMQLDPITGYASSEVLLSQRRLRQTLSAGYFEMLGTLSSSSEGIRILEHFKIFTSLYRISELPNREDLMFAILESLDFDVDGHARILLSKALTCGQKRVRLFATEHLAKLSRETELAQLWQISLLLTQLYDTSIEVCELAVQVLEVACQSLSTLELVVEMRPSLHHLGDIGAKLLTRFLSTSVGVTYLHEIDYVERELDDWFNERNITYVVQVELRLASALGIETNSETRFGGIPPSHFYGELVKTEEGCRLLEDSGHFPVFADFIRAHGLEDFDSDIITQLKSVLWAVGHIGSSTGGLLFLEGEDIVMSIVEIAEDSPVYSLKGTACFILGLIASTVEAVEILDELGWESVCTPLGGPTGVCVPRNLSSLVGTAPWELQKDGIERPRLAATTNTLEREVLDALANLSNHILATKASKTLARLKIRHRGLFSSLSLYFRAIEMIANNHYRLPVRRYILELFDVNLDDRTVCEMMSVGEELKSRSNREEGEEVTGGDAFDAIILGGKLSVGAEGEFTDDEESIPDDDEESIPDEGVKIELKFLSPLLQVRGFVC